MPGLKGKQPSSLHDRLLILLLLFFIASASFHAFFVAWGFQDYPIDDYRRDFQAMMSGTAYRPFVYRQLLPWTVRTLNDVTPQTLKDSIAAAHTPQGMPLYQLLFDSPQALAPAASFEYLCLYLETFLSALLAAGLLYLLCRQEKIDRLSSVAATGLMLLLIPYFMAWGGGAFYDYTEIAFFCLSILLALSRPWWYLIPLAALATWNKESFLFFAITLYPLLHRRNSRKTSLLAMATIFFTSAPVYFHIRTQFALSPGGMVENHWKDQFNFFFHPFSFVFSMCKVYGITLPLSLSVIPLSFFIWTIFRAIHKPELQRAPELRQHLLLAALINLPLFLLFGAPGETRNLSMLFPVFTLCTASCFAAIARKESSDNPGPPGSV